MSMNTACSVRCVYTRNIVLYMQDQYGLIHDAVLESLICGETQIPAQNLPDAMKQLDSIDEKHGKSGYEVQFGVSSRNYL